MTRARSHTWAVGISPLIQPLLEAVLCVLVSLVHHVRATFGMRFNRRDRDWHTDDMREALPQTKQDIQERASPANRGQSRVSEAHPENPGWKPSGDQQTIPSKSSTRILGTSPRMTPLRLKHRNRKRASWHALPAQAGIRSARNARSSHAHLSLSFQPQRVSAKSWNPGATRICATSPRASGSRSNASGMTTHVRLQAA